MRDGPEYARGRNGEYVVAGVLMKRGWYVIPSYEFSGRDDDKAPRLERLGQGDVIPDLDTSRDGARAWVEVKTKGHPALYRKLNREAHGISKRHLADYMKIEEITGCPVYLIIYEEESGDVLVQLLRKLLGDRQDYDGEKMDKGGTVFFPRSAFRLLVNVTEVEGEE